MNPRLKELGLPFWCIPPDEIEVRTNRTNKELLTSAHYFFRFSGGEVVEMYLNNPGEISIVRGSEGSQFKLAKLIHWRDVPEIFRSELWNYLKVEVEEVSFDQEKINFIYFDDPVTIHAIQHCVHSREITMQIMVKLGYYFKKVKFIRKINRLDIFHYTDYQYVIDDKYLVTVTEKFFKGCFFATKFKIRKYHDECALDEPHYGKKAAELAGATGVPWDITLSVCALCPADEEAIALLTAIKNARGGAEIDIEAAMSSAIGVKRCLEYDFKKILGVTLEKLNYNCIQAEDMISLAEYLNSSKEK